MGMTNAQLYFEAAARRVLLSGGNPDDQHDREAVLDVLHAEALRLNGPPVEMTEVEATEEALRLFVRKVRRLHSEAFADVVQRMSDEALMALYAGERRADNRFLDATHRVWPAAPDDEIED